MSKTAPSQPFSAASIETSDQTVSLMLKRLAAFPDRFSQEQQDRLFAERNAWRDARRCASPSRAKAAKAAEAALDATIKEIVWRSQKLVYDLAKKFQERSCADRCRPGAGIPLADLFQEGNQALARAVEQFKPGENARFTTFATRCIRNHLSDVLERWKTFPQPRKTGGSTRGKNVRPSTEPDKLPPASLDAPASPETDESVIDRVPDPNSDAVIKRIESDDMKKQIRRALDTLTDREREVLVFRFGLDDGYSRVLEEVGKQFNVTRERIRMIEKKALRNLRKPKK